jgi:membrane protease YdiL (CAAX protease family)
MSANDPTPVPGPDHVRPDLRAITPEQPAPAGADGAITTTPALEPQPQPRPKPHPGFWWSVLWCIGFLLATQIPGALIAVAIIQVYQLTHPRAFATAGAMIDSPVMSVAMGVAFFATEILVIGVSYVVIRLMVGRDWTRILGLRRPSWPHLGLALASLPGLIVLANLAYALIKRVIPDFAQMFGLGDMMGQSMKMFTEWPWPFAVLVIGMGPGIGEELWCRGFLGRGLVGKYGAVFGIVLASFFFGAIHVEPRQASAAMLIGLYLHFTYLVTRSLLVPMLLHFLNNSLAVIGSRIPALEALDADPATSPVHLFVTAAVLLVAAGWALYASRACLEWQGVGEVWRPEIEPGVEYPPDGTGTRVVRPRPGLLPVALTVLALGAFVWSCHAALSGK